MDDIYAQIAGFNFRIFSGKKNKIDPSLFVLIKKFELDLFYYLNSFILIDKPKKVDFEIFVKANMTVDVVKNVKAKKEYIFLLEEVSNSKFVIDPQISLQQFELVVKKALFILLRKNHGFTIHASSCKTKGGAFIFLGESGAGKSTIVQLLNKKFPTLSDDLTFIRKLRKQYYVYQVPFIEKNWIFEKSREPIKLSKVFFINKSKDNSVDNEANLKFITKRIMDQTVISINSDPLIKKEISTFIKTLKKFYTLNFNKYEDDLIGVLGKTYEDK